MAKELRRRGWKVMAMAVLVGTGVVALSAQPAESKPKKKPDKTADAGADSGKEKDGGSGSGKDLRGPRGTCKSKSECSSQSGEECVDGACICDVAKGNARCTPTQDFCTWLKVNANNCGACGHNCGPRGTCNEGKCTSCKPNESVCPGSNDKLTDWDRSCHDLMTEDDNCGRCGRECPSSFYCKNGRCVL